ncbi:hypothetical protein AOLI_G00235620 [Acnodon oligacanthus]
MLLMASYPSCTERSSSYTVSCGSSSWLRICRDPARYRIASSVMSRALSEPFSVFKKSAELNLRSDRSRQSRAGAGGSSGVRRAGGGGRGVRVGTGSDLKVQRRNTRSASHNTRKHVLTPAGNSRAWPRPLPPSPRPPSPHHVGERGVKSLFRFRTESDLLLECISSLWLRGFPLQRTETCWFLVVSSRHSCTL